MIFLASPYYDPNPEVRNWRYEKAVLFCANYALVNSRSIYSPIVHWHPAAKMRSGLYENDMSFWMSLNRPMLEICEELWILALPGWEKSKGIAAEIDFVRNLNRPILLRFENSWKYTS